MEIHSGESEVGGGGGSNLTQSWMLGMTLLKRLC